MQLETLLANITKYTPLEDPYAASHLPIYNTATFDLNKQQGKEHYDYSRSGNPTRAALEHIFTLGENGFGCRCTNTGLSAIALILEATLHVGDHILVEQDCYGGTFRLISSMQEHYNLNIHFVDFTNLDEVSLQLSQHDISLVICESPTNPGIKIVDLKAIAKLCKQHTALMAVDNSMATFASQKPLDLGADFSFFSTTKFISGHGSVTAGAVVSKTEALHDKIAFMCNAQGRAQSPMDVYLTSLGLPTLIYRMKAQEKNAEQLAQFLKSHTTIKQIKFAGDKDHPQHTLAKGQMNIIPAVMTFDLKTTNDVEQLMNRTKLFGKKVSFGTSDSRIEVPMYMSHASVSKEHLAKHGISETTVRLSVGLENIDDLIDDLTQALA